jgi:hypothetical protein
MMRPRDPDDDLIIWDDLDPDEAAKLRRLVDRFAEVVERIARRVIEDERAEVAQLNEIASLPTMQTLYRRPRLRI